MFGRMGLVDSVRNVQDLLRSGTFQVVIVRDNGMVTVYCADPTIAEMLRSVMSGSKNGAASFSTRMDASAAITYLRRQGLVFSS